MDVTKAEVDSVSTILTLLLEWSGATDESPDDTEIINVNGAAVSLGDIRDASVTLGNLSALVQTKRK